METTAIFRAAIKLLPENYDIEYYLSILFQYPENEWFSPTNESNNAYSICEELMAVRLISARRIPIWVDGSFKGVHTQCYYSKNLVYIF